MAGPGDNSTRVKAKAGGDGESFRRAVSVCVRAIAGDHDLEVGFAKDQIGGRTIRTGVQNGLWIP